VPDAEWRSHQPSNLWWSEDSQTLFYQDELAQQAWTYDVKSQTARSINYTPRSADALATEYESRLPHAASLAAVSPSHRRALFATPLAEPIPLSPPRFTDENVNPQFSAELWLLEDGVTTRLGLVDFCFFTQAPIWSAEENKAVVNSGPVFDAERACMFAVWLIDTQRPSVGPFPSSWEDEGVYYQVQDLSADGRYALVSEVKRDPIQYILDLRSGEPMAVTRPLGSSVLLQVGPRFVVVGQSIERDEADSEQLITRLWLHDPSDTTLEPLAELQGSVSQWCKSPNQQ
jgi:hypothetical protein